jgi:hypothetical protein
MRIGYACRSGSGRASAQGIGECLREKDGVWMFKPARVVAVASPVPGIAA